MPTPADGLVSLLAQLSAAITEKDEKAVGPLIGKIQGFYESALKSVNISWQDSVKVQDFHFILQKDAVGNKQLEELQAVLRQGVSTQLLLSIELSTPNHQILAWMVFRRVVAQLAAEQNKNLLSYDCSFLSNQSHQTQLGKGLKKNQFHAFFLFPYFRHMKINYWGEDVKKEVIYLTAAQKKPFKIKRKEGVGGRLQYSNRKGAAQTLQNGNYLYVLSPKGGLYLLPIY